MDKLITRVVNSCMFTMKKCCVLENMCVFHMKANEVEQKISTALSSPLKRLRLICFSGLKHEYLYFVTHRPNQYHNANNAVCVVLKVKFSNPCLLLYSSTGYQIFKHGFPISKPITGPGSNRSSVITEIR